MDNIIDFLEVRGFIDQITSPKLREAVEKPIKVYVGFDPTSDSLHLGNLVGIMALAWFQKFGHTPCALVGGATGMVGDPSGKSQERNLLDANAVEKNIQGIKKNLEDILCSSSSLKKPVFLNNYTWFQNMPVINFLRDIGKYFRVNTMLTKESVKARIDSQEGISYTEFTYQILQAYDFNYLSEHEEVILQVGGSDQWGNITAGVDLVRRLQSREVYGLTFPLITRSDGKKFGKSESGAIWLSKDKLSPFEFYQYLYRVPDEDVGKLMRMLTFMDLQEIQWFENKICAKDYQPNSAQKKLAEEVTRIVHGEEGVQAALITTHALAPGSSTNIEEMDIDNLPQDVPVIEFSHKEFVNEKWVDILSHYEIVKSKGESRRLIRGGGLYINNDKLCDEHAEFTLKNLVRGEFVLVALGKKKKVILKAT